MGMYEEATYMQEHSRAAENTTAEILEPSISWRDLGALISDVQQSTSSGIPQFQDFPSRPFPTRYRFTVRCHPRKIGFHRLEPSLSQSDSLMWHSPRRYAT